MTSNIEIIRCCISKTKIPKKCLMVYVSQILRDDIHLFCTPIFKICSWMPLTMVKSLLLNSSLLKIRIPALDFICLYASSVINKVRNPITVCGFHLPLRIPLTVAEPRTTSYICFFRNLRRNKCADKIYATVICTLYIVYCYILERV